MLDLGWTEILIVGVVALIVIGPRDLPVALHTFGKYIAKLKSMAREFQSGIDDIARQHELKELQEGINKFKSPEQAIENYVSGLENQGVKPKAEEPELVEPESENSIAGDNPGRARRLERRGGSLSITCSDVGCRCAGHSLRWT